jgi:SAM-dependent methyltransferase
VSPRSTGSYGRFAAYYDFIYHEIVNYEGDVDFLEAVYQRRMHPRPHSLLDLGCGTGNHDLPLATRGYDVTGIDRSADQLAVARRKAEKAGLGVRFVRADMRSFNLGRTFDAALCMFGAFGYLTRTSDMVRCLRSLRRHLRSQGLFMFEFWQTSAVRPQQGWFYKAGREYELVRLSEGRFDARRHLLSVEFRFFVFRSRRVLDHFEETHTVRTYAIPEMRGILRRGGFDLLATYAATPEKKTFRPAARNTFRIMAVARPRRPNQS